MGRLSRKSTPKTSVLGEDRRGPRRAVVGAADHADWTVLVTLAADGAVLDRRRLVLVDAGLPSYPHHHDGQKLPLPEALKLVEQVRASAERNAAAGLAALAAELPVEVVGIAIKKCPTLPGTIEERITNYRAQCVADFVMYRQALAAAATSRGWAVHWYDAKTVLGHAVRARIAEAGKALGPPWQKEHKLAMAAALAVAR